MATTPSINCKQWCIVHFDVLDGDGKIEDIMVSLFAKTKDRHSNSSSFTTNNLWNEQTDTLSRC